MKSFNRDCKLPQVFMRRDQCFISCLRVSRITVCGPEKIRIRVSYCWSTEAGGIQTRLGGEGAIFCLPAAGGVGCVGVRSRHLSDLGPLCCCSPGQVVALALGWWPLAPGWWPWPWVGGHRGSPAGGPARGSSPGPTQQQGI